MCAGRADCGPARAGYDYAHAYASPTTDGIAVDEKKNKKHTRSTADGECRRGRGGSESTFVPSSRTFRRSPIPSVAPSAVRRRHAPGKKMGPGSALVSARVAFPKECRECGSGCFTEICFDCMKRLHNT